MEILGFENDLSMLWINIPYYTDNIVATSTARRLLTPRDE